ncbi:MAG: hypothetical protein GY865_05320 [candidate division Zixibacteria bacterium]|nr:hypothetical protein [candidate division Zixibacteria bacterium]
MKDNVKIEWHGKKALVTIDSALGRVNKRVAQNIMEDAKRILKRKSKSRSETSLLEQFDVRKSKYKSGGYLVYCQGPGNWKPPYRASFVELGGYSSVYGTYKRKGAKSLKGISPVYIEPKPFLRPAARKNKRKAQRMYQEALDRL